MDHLDFLKEVQYCLDSNGVTDLSAAGVNLPLDIERLKSGDDDGYDSLCYICFWIYMQGWDLHNNLITRMVLGPQNKWTKMYSFISSGSRDNDKIKEIFNQAS